MLTAKKLCWVPLNLEIILLSGEDSSQHWPQSSSSFIHYTYIALMHILSPACIPHLCHLLYRKKIRCCLQEVCKSHACCCTMINTAVSANGIITFLINLSNLLHLFLVLCIGFLKFSICLCAFLFVYVQFSICLCVYLNQRHEISQVLQEPVLQEMCLVRCCVSPVCQI